MEYQKNFNKFKEFIGLFDESINNNDFQQLNKFYPLIEDFEVLFLSGYQKRKKEGVFYTNKEISDFIVSEALLSLINKKFNDHDQDFKEIKSLDEIYKSNLEFKQKLRELLLNVKICDPACGSGGFLVSSADIIFTILRRLELNITESNIKNQILKNLFGYDINECAIKLCILKLLRWYQNKFDNNMEKSLSILISNLKLQNSIINSNFPKFDIIIGNPPYGNILNQNEKEILKKENIFYKDIYCAFLLKALKWSNEIIGFLVPKSFLLRQGYINFRHDFLSRANIIKIFDIGSKMFKTATNEVQIVLYENKNGYKNRDLNVYNYPKTKIITYLNQCVDSLRICHNLNCPLSLKSKKLYVYTFKKNCPFCESGTVQLNRIRIKPNEEIYELVEKIENIGDLNYLNPVDYPKMIRGEEEKGLQLVKRKLRKDTNGSCFFISARNDFKYYNFRKIKSFNIEEVDSKFLKGNNYEYYKHPKLLIKHNNIIPEAIYTEDNVCFTSSIYSLLHNDIDKLKYICAVLNSSLIQFYCIYGINNQKDTTINLNQYMIRHLPIVNPDDNVKMKIVEKVEKIRNSFIMSNQIVDEKVHQLLKEIDDLIFNQYSITENEKNLIISDVRDQIKHFEAIYSN
ncbi:MAG: Eco57I restriction-modification methylase domain-containing protein [Candidatus Lokiarchaeota archaeon]|nr:Eco57I restriction-modification methylase domain-containing protein [Candidatus Lokiarchaeota archaeon]